MTQLKLPFVKNIYERCSELQKETAILKDENIRLKEQLKLLQVKEKAALYANVSNAAVIRENNSAYVAQGSIPIEADSHIKLFHELFIGRDDVYAEHWYGKDGRSNYSPAKAHEWDKHIIDPKTHRKICGDSCKLLPVTDKVIAEHLSGKRIIGTYPLS